MPYRTFVSLTLIGALLLSEGACSRDEDNNRVGIPSGLYSDVSESESKLRLILHPDGTAQLESIGWSPGNYNEATVEAQDATWRASGNVLTLRYGEIEDKLCFSDRLSHREFGQDGSGPGLKACGKAPIGSKVGNRGLWHENSYP